MTVKKILGYIFIVASIILMIIIIGQLPKILGVIIGVVKIFSGELDSYQVGKVIGAFIYWMFHSVITIFLWIMGRRWIKSS